MNYSEFFRKFGGSGRTKNIQKPFLRGWWRSRKRGYRPTFRLPSQSLLPKEFIRLCPWEMEFLFLLSSRARAGILEIGRFNGGSSFLMSCANDVVPIYSIDIAPKDDALLQTFFAANGVGKNVHLIIGDSQRGKFDAVKGFDLLFIDGDHSYDGCMRDIENWYGQLLPGGIMLFHDSYLGGEGVQDAVIDFVAKHPELETIASPYIGASYWRNPTGSMAAFRKMR